MFGDQVLGTTQFTRTGRSPPHASATQLSAERRLPLLSMIHFHLERGEPHRARQLLEVGTAQGVEGLERLRHLLAPPRVSIGRPATERAQVDVRAAFAFANENHRGEWVAIHADGSIEAADSLAQLMARVSGHRRAGPPPLIHRVPTGNE